MMAGPTRRASPACHIPEVKRPRIARIVPVVLACWVATAFPLAAQLRVPMLEEIVADAASEGFEGVVLVADAGEVVLHGAIGYADAERSTPLTPDTRFAIASITKLFTAISILQLVDEGRLGLDDSVAELLPDLGVPGGERITVHHLLLHISGLPDEPDMIYFDRVDSESYIRRTLEGPAGIFGEFNYANVDYVLLGLVVSRLDGESWEASVRNRILEPLGMGDTGLLDGSDPPEPFARRIATRDGRRRAAPFPPVLATYGAAGGMYSTAEDLLKLDRGLYSDTLLSEESRELLEVSYPEYNYSGYSVWTYRYPFLDPAPLVMERRGQIGSAVGVLVRFPELDRTLVILSHNAGFDPNSFGDRNSLKEALMGEMGRER